MNFFFTKRPKSGAAVIDAVLGNAETLDVATEELAAEEVAAVIALALHLYTKRLQEYENTVVTIQQVIKPYSPWSSKIYGMRQQPLHIPGLRSRIR
jgi:hypothetical protein